MFIALPLILVTVFVILALWHFYMATFVTSSASGAIPSVDGKPLFVPARATTIAVGFCLLLCAMLIGATAGFIALPLSKSLLIWCCYALAFGLFVRAVGEFKYLGFFKRIRNSRFATLDTWVYSPLCLLLAVGVYIVAIR